mmetsp:Transcript_120522/g.286318  ORF Transcript_120522/g.286318 Transcript_120522/m.286318 type:complete len:409 (+) Transcript_120522:555-1781(+)
MGLLVLVGLSVDVFIDALGGFLRGQVHRRPCGFLSSLGVGFSFSLLVHGPGVGNARQLLCVQTQSLHGLVRGDASSRLDDGFRRGRGLELRVEGTDALDIEDLALLDGVGALHANGHVLLGFGSGLTSSLLLDLQRHISLTLGCYRPCGIGDLFGTRFALLSCRCRGFNYDLRLRAILFDLLLRIRCCHCLVAGSCCVSSLRIGCVGGLRCRRGLLRRAGLCLYLHRCLTARLGGGGCLSFGLLSRIGQDLEGSVDLCFNDTCALVAQRERRNCDLHGDAHLRLLATKGAESDLVGACPFFLPPGLENSLIVPAVQLLDLREVSGTNADLVVPRFADFALVSGGTVLAVRGGGGGPSFRISRCHIRVTDVQRLANETILAHLLLLIFSVEATLVAPRLLGHTLLRLPV